MDFNKDFRTFAKDHHVSMTVYDDFVKKTNDGKLFSPCNSLTPVILEERQLRASAVDIYSRMLLDRIIFFGNEFNSETCNIVTAELLYLDSIGDKDINIFIASGGGIVSGGLGIIDVISYINSDVSTTCISTAASMGAVLLSCGTKGKRFALPHSRVMLHQVSSGMNTSTYADLAISLEQTKRYQDDLFKILAENMNKTVEEIEKICNRDHWYIGQEAVDAGIVDKIIDKKK